MRRKLEPLARRLKLGILAKLAESGIRSIAVDLGLRAPNLRFLAWSADQLSRRHIQRAPNTASKVVGLRQTEKSVPVYDLTISCDKCYYANGLLVSNSDGFLTFATGYQPITYEEEEHYDNAYGNSSTTGY